MTKVEKIENFLNELSTEIDVLNHVDCGEVNSYDEVYSQIDEGQGFDIEVIYYSNAMEYLTKNDTSLTESLGIAAEMGFTPESINSELLASLLQSREVRSEFEELEDEITTFFDELEDE